jgi:hypothetical protein
MYAPGEHVEEGEGLSGIAMLSEATEIAGECLSVTAHISDPTRL